MELKTKNKFRFVYKMCMILFMGCLLCACPSSDGSDEPTPTPTPTPGPSLTVNPTNLTFTYEKNDKHDLTIKTDVNWRIVYKPSWLTASSDGGNSQTTITLATTTANESSEARADQIEIEATNSSGVKTSVKVDVTQLGAYQTDCYAHVMDAQYLIMSYGFACVVECGKSTQYFHWTIMSESEYNNIKGNNSQIVENSKKWTRVNVPSELKTEIVYDACQPNTSYYLVMVGYASNGSNGEIYPYSFTTKASEAPLAEITPEPSVVNEVHGGDQGPWFKWEVKKNGTCAAYYTYACASDKELTTMKNRKADYGKYEPMDGVKVAWEIWKEHKSNQLTHKTTFNSDNANGREQLFEAYTEGSTQWITAKTSDKYLQIVTWSIDRNNNYSGLVYDLVYKVEDGKLIPQPNSGSVVLEASPTSLQFSAAGGTEESKTITVNANTDWTVSSSIDWCVIDRTFGSNNGSIKVHVKSNDTSSSRSALITITATSSGKYAEVRVSQDGKIIDTVIGRDEYDDDKNLDGGGTTYTLSVTPTTLSTSAAGETKNVNVTSNDSWTVSSNQSWCTVSPTSGSNNGTIKITTSKNTSSSSRSATITIKGANSGSKTITVSQDAYTLSVSPSSLQMKSEGESKTVSVSSNDSWTVSSNQSWCTVSPASGSNNGTFTIKTASNSSSSRTATVTIRGTNSGKSATVSVSQEAGTVIGRDEYGNDKEIK